MLFDEQIQDYFKKQSLPSNELRNHLKVRLLKLLDLLENPKGVPALCSAAVQLNCYLIGLEIDLESVFGINFDQYKNQIMSGLAEEDVTAPTLCEDS